MRKPRKIIHGYSYHVIARINRQEFLFKSPELKELFLTVIKRAKEKYNFSIKNFCIMGNHIHIIIKPLKGESLSKIMQWILSVFAIIFNKKFNLIGHVWYDRFKSKVILSFQQYLRTFIYIANNPVRANIVIHAVDYQYNGICFIQAGILDIVEKPSDFVLKKIMKEIL